MQDRQSLTERLQSGIDFLRLSIAADHRDRLIDYVYLLDKWNKHYNLTAIRDRRQMIAMHILDSLSVLPYIKAGSLMDIGTGAGIPGIPLAINKPDLAVTLVDSNSKKIRFCRQAAMELGLQNIASYDQRIEEINLQQPPTQIISRALKSLPEIMQLVERHFSAQTEILAMKGKNPVDEIARLQATGLLVESVRLSVPEIDAERHLIIIKK